MCWQDKLTIISFIIGAVSLGLTIWTLVYTGLIKKAVDKTQKELMNKFKFTTHRVSYLNKIVKIKTEIARINKERVSSDQIKELSFEIEEVIKWLEDANAHFSSKDKNKVNIISNRLNEMKADEYIFDISSLNELRSFCMDLTHLLSKEDYYL